MSSQQVQFLQRQVERKNAQIQVLLAALDGCDREKELSESVACAFAWDLAADCKYDPAQHAIEVYEWALGQWAGALEDSRAAREEAGK